MSTASFDLTDPQMAEALAGCQVGEEKTATVTLTPTRIIEGRQMQADITSISDVQGAGYEEEGEPVEEEGAEAALPEPGRSTRPRSVSPGLAIVVGKVAKR